MIKKLISFLLSFLMVSLVIVPKSETLVVAGAACNADPNSNACRVEKAKESKARIDQYNKDIENAEKTLESAQKLANEYYALGVELQEDIYIVEGEISLLNEQIAALEIDIKNNEERVELLNERVKETMINAQGTMHFNPLLDFLLGADGFADMLRRTYGVEAIMSKESADRVELLDTIALLEEEKKELDLSKETLVTQEEELIQKKEEYDLISAYYIKVKDETKELLEETLQALETEKYSYKEALNFIGDVSSLDSLPSFGRSFSGAGYSISGPFPKYKSGKIHLGVDYTVRYATLRAPAHAIVIMAYQGCGYGYIGCTCGGDRKGNGQQGGGNQISIMTSVNNKVYAISYMHLSQVKVDRYQVVLQGDVLGITGSSGNSSGPHCHVEVYYLGEGDWSDIQNDYLLRSWSTSYNCGWGTYGYNNTRCAANGNKAPCRLDARTILYEH